MASRSVALVSYASPDLVPSSLKRIAVVTGAAPDGLARLSPTWVTDPSLAAANLQVLGAVSYASLDLVPSSLQAFALDGDYMARVQALGPISYWPMDEASGLVAYDRSGNGFNGAYSGVTLGSPGIGDGRTCPLFDGVNDLCNIYSASLANGPNGFNGAEGTAMAWCQVSGAGIWTDGQQRVLFSLQVDGGNGVIIMRHSLNYNIEYIYRAGGAQKGYDKGSLSSTGWLCVAFSWSKSADKARCYLGGVQVGGNLTTLGNWVGALAPTSSCIGTFTTTPSNDWSGSIAHAALWNRALSAAEIASLAVVS